MKEFKRKKDNKVQWFSPPSFTHASGYKMCFEVRSGTSDDIYFHMIKGSYGDFFNQCSNHHHDYAFDYNYGDKKKE